MIDQEAMVQAGLETDRADFEATDQEQAVSIVDLEILLDQEKCTKQFVMNARKNAKFRSNRLKENQSIVKNVSVRRSHSSSY